MIKKTTDGVEDPRLHKAQNDARKRSLRQSAEGSTPNDVINNEKTLIEHRPLRVSFRSAAVNRLKSSTRLREDRISITDHEVQHPGRPRLLSLPVYVSGTVQVHVPPETQSGRQRTLPPRSIRPLPPAGMRSPTVARCGDADAHRNGKDDRTALDHHFLSTRTAGGRKADLLHTDGARDGKGNGRAGTAGQWGWLPCA